jgi:hypothetical protein
MFTAAVACMHVSSAGFVPPSNPHDTVQLFSSITEALEHLWQQDSSQVGEQPAHQTQCLPVVLSTER